MWLILVYITCMQFQAKGVVFLVKGIFDLLYGGSIYFLALFFIECYKV